MTILNLIWSLILKKILKNIFRFFQHQAHMFMILLYFQLVEQNNAVFPD